MCAGKPSIISRRFHSKHKGALFMITVGQIEKKTQARVVALFRDRLHYDQLGDKIELDHFNIEPELLAAWLKKQKVSDTLIGRPSFTF